MKTQKQRMLDGELYFSGGEELCAERLKCRLLTEKYNGTSITDFALRTEILHELFGKVGKNIYIEPTFKCDYGYNISVGDNFYANYDCIILDVNKVTAGDNVFLAPRVCIYTAGHPIIAKMREEQLEFGLPVVIGSDVWIGGGVTVNPGITIGSNVVIGSGSVVTKDIPSNVVAAGNPCKVIREINERDNAFWTEKRNKYFSE